MDILKASLDKRGGPVTRVQGDVSKVTCFNKLSRQPRQRWGAGLKVAVDDKGIATSMAHLIRAYKYVRRLPSPYPTLHQLPTTTSTLPSIIKFKKNLFLFSQCKST